MFDYFKNLCYNIVKRHHGAFASVQIADFYSPDLHSLKMLRLYLSFIESGV